MRLEDGRDAMTDSEIRAPAEERRAGERQSHRSHQALWRASARTRCPPHTAERQQKKGASSQCR